MFLTVSFLWLFRQNLINWIIFVLIFEVPKIDFMNDLVSIITPTYNSAKYIEFTIDSVIKQTYRNWEMIIVDDNSLDETVEIIQKHIHFDDRIKLIELDKNYGPAIARNKAIENAKGKFISFLDSDDIWMPSKLEKQVNFLKKNNYPICFTTYELIDKNNHRLNKVLHAVRCLDLHNYLKDTRIGFSTSMINKEIVGKFEMMNIRTRQDGQLWIFLMKRGFKAYGIDEILCQYRVHKDSISANKIKATINIWKLYYKIEKLGLFKSCYYFSHYLTNAIKKRI